MSLKESFSFLDNICLVLINAKDCLVIIQGSFRLESMREVVNLCPSVSRFAGDIFCGLWFAWI
jgi:hypothetical protein